MRLGAWLPFKIEDSRPAGGPQAAAVSLSSLPGAPSLVLSLCHLVSVLDLSNCKLGDTGVRQLCLGLLPHVATMSLTCTALPLSPLPFLVVKCHPHSWSCKCDFHLLGLYLAGNSLTSAAAEGDITACACLSSNNPVQLYLLSCALCLVAPSSTPSM